MDTTFNQIDNEFIRTQLLVACAQRCKFFIGKVHGEEIDKLEHDIGLELEKGTTASEIDDQKLERMVNKLEWRREQLAEWASVLGTINSQLPESDKVSTSSNSDARARARALLNK